MNFLLSITILSITLMIIIISISILISKSLNKQKSISSPFECGFNPLNPLRSQFSIQFFLIGVLFLIFDIEIILILPLPLIMLKSLPIFISSIFTILILILGLIYEWKSNSLQWL